MGINLEYATLLHELEKKGALKFSGSVMELGAQDMSANPNAIASHILKMNHKSSAEPIRSAKELYSRIGFSSYDSIDATGLHDSKILDLNFPLVNQGFTETFDLVTNLGTIEHCFNISDALKNTHHLCKVGGTMIHAFPSGGNTNHGFYNIQPRLLLELANSNDYSILEFAFTVDYRPTLYKYSTNLYRRFDDRDLMCYIALKKNNNNEFKLPFDNYFDGKLSSYANNFDVPVTDLLKSYIKSDWTNITQTDLSKVPTNIVANSSFIKKIFKRITDFLGDLLNQQC